MYHLNKKFNICIAGEGGQGVQTVAKIIADAFYTKKVPVTYVPNYGVEQRGGVSIAFVRISSDVISYPKFSQADILVVLSNRSIDRVKEYIGPETIIFYNKDFVTRKMPKKYKGFNFNKMAGEFGSAKTFNMIVLGLIIKTMNSLPLQVIIKAVHQKFANKYEIDSKMKDLNEQAINYGYNLL